ncbi:hypothetical protein ACFVVX_13620 [Kitasatospora sp. NPDC058170]|uniref:hypothetical protein n=1 Tax=Kitasatospora sp. NPDC058170 TaxID=3346364 RepID=UPI0036D99C53
MSVNPTVNRRAAAALGAIAVAGSLFAAVPAQAADGTGSPSAAPSAAPSARQTPKGDGAKGICKRLPKTEERVAKALDRLNGDATVVGSIARLQQRVTDAKTAGHTPIATYLNDRLTARRSLLTTLQTRQSDLKAVATWCAANNQGSTK